MDIYQLIDLTERLLILYGYEVERDIGVEGKPAEVGDLSRETKEGMPTETMAPITYMADIFAEKKDIERPFGRIVVRYNRTQTTADVSDIAHTAKVKEAANAYMGIYLTTTGFSEDAKEHADSQQIRIFTPDDIERLIGKAMVTKPWWSSVKAYPVFLTYDEMLWKARHTFTNWFHRTWDVTKMPYQALNYMPYWKYSYSVVEKKSEYEAKTGLGKFAITTGTTGINAHNGLCDIWWDYDPIQLQELIGSKTHINVWPGYMGGEMYLELLWEPHVEFTTVEKPKDFPAGLRFEVYKPAIEKWEAKVAATHWISFFFNTDPKNVMISNLEMIYLPWWVYRVNHLPYIKNPWGEVEWFTMIISPHLTDVFNLWKLREYRRNIVYLMAEKYLSNLFGSRRYIKMMNIITYKFINRLLFYDLHVRPSYRWIDLFFVVLFMSMVYGMLAFKTGLSLLVFIALLFIFIGPGYALLYVTRAYLMHYPWGTEQEGRMYSAPKVYKKVSKKLLKADFKKDEKRMALAKLEEMYVNGELGASQKKRFEKYWSRRAKKEIEKAKALGGV